MVIDYIHLMRQLLPHAQSAAERGEVPVAAMMIDKNGAVVAVDHNRVEETSNALAHAEMLVIDKAIKQCGEKFLSDHTLLVTLEPCALCAAAISTVRIKTLVFGGYDEKSGGVLSGARVFANPHCHHRPEVIDGILRHDCEQLMKDFFAGKR